MLSFYWIPLILSLGIFIGMVLASLFAVQDMNDEAEAKEFKFSRSEPMRTPLQGELNAGHH